jgi:hypothetical protein
MIVTHPASPRGEDSLAHTINQAVLAAVQHAADPTAHPHQLTELGLEPWSVKRVATFAQRKSGGVLISASQWSPRLGQTLGDVAAQARSLVAGSFALPQETLAVEWLLGAPTTPQSDLLAEAMLQPGCDVRRKLIDPTYNSITSIRRAAGQRRNLDAMIARIDGDDRAAANFAAQLPELVRDSPPDTAARLLFHLAERYARSGRWEQAAECWDAIAVRHPDAELRPAALVRLVQYWSSSEAAWRAQRVQRFAAASVGKAPQALEQVDAPRAGPAATSEGQAGDYQARRATQLSIDDSKLVDRAGRAAAAAKLLAQAHPALYAEPYVRFPLAIPVGSACAGLN